MLRGAKNLGLKGWGAIFGILASIATVIALFVGGDGGNSVAPTTTPEKEESIQAVAKDFLEDFHAGLFGALWDGFHPAVQDVIPRDRYIKCQTRWGPPVPASLKFRATGAANVEMDGVPDVVSSVIYELSYIDGDKREAQVLVVPGKSIRTLPPQFEYNAYIRGKCPPAQDPDAPSGNPGSSNDGA